MWLRARAIRRFVRILGFGLRMQCRGKYSDWIHVYVVWLMYRVGKVSMGCV
jgi:hypothetical protein